MFLFDKFHIFIFCLRCLPSYLLSDNAQFKCSTKYFEYLPKKNKIIRLSDKFFDCQINSLIVR